MQTMDGLQFDVLHALHVHRDRHVLLQRALLQRVRRDRGRHALLQRVHHDRDRRALLHHVHHDQHRHVFQ